MIKTTLKIDGMKCGMCEAHVNDVIRRNFNIKKVKSSHAKKETVILSEGLLDNEQLMKIIGAEGYNVKDIASETYVKKGLFSRL